MIQQIIKVVKRTLLIAFLALQWLNEELFLFCICVALLVSSSMFTWMQELKNKGHDIWQRQQIGTCCLIALFKGSQVTTLKLLLSFSASCVVCMKMSSSFFSPSCRRQKLKASNKNASFRVHECGTLGLVWFHIHMLVTALNAAQIFSSSWRSCLSVLRVNPLLHTGLPNVNKIWTIKVILKIKPWNLFNL